MFMARDVEGFEDEKEGVMRTEDVRRAMKYVRPALSHKELRR